MYYIDSDGNLQSDDKQTNGYSYRIRDDKLVMEKYQPQQNSQEKSLGEKAFNVLSNFSPYLKAVDLGVKAYNFVKEGDYNSIIKTPEAFKDGYDFGDITKTYYGTQADLVTNYVQGIMQTGEGLGDLISYGNMALAKATGNDEMAEQIKQHAMDNAIAETMNYIRRETGIDKHSILGNKTKEITQGLGNASLMVATAGLGNAANLGTKGSTILTSALTAASSTGSGMSEAYSEGTTDSQSITYGLINGVADAGTELLFGGLGQGANAIGLSKSAIGVDDALAKKVSGMFKSRLGKNLSEYGIKATFEGLEEVIAGFIQGFGKWITYKSDENFGDILKDENLLDQFIMGATISGIMQTPGFIKNTKANRDFVTGYTQDEQATIDSEVQRRIDEQQKDGKKLSTKEINQINENVEQEFKDIQQAKTMNIEDFRNNATKLFPSLSENDRILYNNLVNDISQFMYVTNSNVKFDETLQTLYQWDGGTLILNPTMTDTPIRNILTSEYGHNIFSEETTKNILQYAKDNKMYDSLKNYFESKGYIDVDSEIISSTLDYILNDTQRINDVLTKNEKDFNNFKNTIKSLNDTITQNRNTKDSYFINELNDKLQYIEDNKGKVLSSEVVKEGNEIYNNIKNKKQIVRTTNSLTELLKENKTKDYGMSTQLLNKGKGYTNYGQQVIYFKPEILNYVDKMFKGDGATNRETYRPENPNRFSKLQDAVANNPNFYDEMLIKGNVPVIDLIDSVKIPANSSDELIELLNKNGIKYELYNPGPSYNETKETKEYENKKKEQEQQVKVEEKGQQVKSEEKERKAYTSIINSDSQTEEAKNISKELLGTDTYIPDSNKQELERADTHIEKYGVDESLNQLRQNTESTRNNADDIAIGNRLIEYYSKIGDADKLTEAMQLTAMAGTNVGRGVQAMALLNRMTPTGQATWIQRSVDKLNKQMKERFDKSKNPFKKLQQFNFTAEMQQKIVNSTEENLQQNLDEVYKELGKQVKMSTMEALDTWRYFSMLSNPSTHIRNIIGNFFMGKLQGVKDIIKGGIEDVIVGKKGERESTLLRASKKYRDFAKNDIKNVEARLGLGDNKYTNPKNKLQQNMRMFSNTKVGRFLENTLKKGPIDFTSKALEVEDIWGLKAAYKKYMSQYLYANKIDLDNITDKQLAKARNYAIDQAKQATFHQDSYLATILNQFENKNLLNKLVVGGIVPFKKTPFNVAKTSLEYNPAGLLKTLTYDSVRLYNGQITANQYIDNISKGLTGTGIALLGYALAKMGFIRTTDDDDESYEEDKGVQPYSIVLGDKTISLDWLSPSAVPLFVGAEIEKQFENTDTNKTEVEQERSLKDSIYNVLNASVSSLNPVSEMTMLSGIQDALKSYSKDSAKAFEEIGTNTIKTYVNQYVPSILGKVAKSTDEYERSTTSTETTTIGKAIDYIKNQTMSKIPGLRNKLPVKTDVWGNEVKQNENPLLRTVYNLTSPATIKDKRETELDKEINRLYESTGKTAVIPKNYIDKSFTYGDKDYKLTNQQYATYKAAYGKSNYEILSNLIKTSDYKSLSDEDKAELISTVYTYSKNVNKDAYAQINKINFTPSNTYNAQKKSTALGGKIEDYLLYNIYRNNTKADKDANGNAISGSKKTKMINYLNSHNMNYNQKLYLLAKDYSITNQEKSYLAYLINNTNLTSSEKIDMYNDLSGFKVDANGNVRW